MHHEPSVAQRRRETTHRRNTMCCEGMASRHPLTGSSVVVDKQQSNGEGVRPIVGRLRISRSEWDVFDNQNDAIGAGPE